MVTPPADTSPVTPLPTLAFVLAEVALGAMAGVAVARFTTSSGMGWDQIANVLGGLMGGGVLGLIAGVVTVRRLPHRAKVPAALVSMAIAAGLAIFLSQVPPTGR